MPPSDLDLADLVASVEAGVPPSVALDASGAESAGVEAEDALRSAAARVHSDLARLVVQAARQDPRLAWRVLQAAYPAQWAPEARAVIQGVLYAVQQALRECSLGCPSCGADELVCARCRTAVSAADQRRQVQAAVVSALRRAERGGVR